MTKTRTFKDYEKASKFRDKVGGIIEHCPSLDKHYKRIYTYVVWY